MKIQFIFLAPVLLANAISGRSKDQVLKELNEAVVSSNGEAVVRLTDELKTLVPASPEVPEPKRTSRPTLLSSVKPHEASATTNATVGFLASKAEKTQGAALFEDMMFAMTPAAKEELRAQLSSGAGAEAVSWIQTGGWYHCAYDSQVCKCNGQVRYGEPHTNRWSPAKPASGTVQCASSVFGDPAPGQAKQCNCHRSSFTLTKNENSGSYLQESWIFLTRTLARMKWLPFTGDRRHHGIELWSARHGGHPGGTLERYWIEKYIVEMSQHIPGGNCLEWGLYYVNWLSQCTNKYENAYEPVLYGQKQPSVEGNTVYGSIYDFPAIMGAANLQFNFVCATELFEHLEKPYEGAADLYNVMAPGGAVLFTAPQQAQYHKVPQDFLRYTKEGAVHVMEVAGFCVPRQLMAGSGDFIFDVGRNTGLQLQDFTMEEMDEGYQRGYEQIADGAMTIHLMAYKPPHPYCR